MICQWFVNDSSINDNLRIQRRLQWAVDPPWILRGCRFWVSTEFRQVVEVQPAPSYRGGIGRQVPGRGLARNGPKVVCACRLFNNVQYISRFFISCQFIEFMSCCQGDLWHILTLPCTSHGSRCTYAGTGFRNIGSPAFGMKRKPFLGRKLTKKISFNIILFFE